MVAEGGIILISEGTYTETLEVSADDVTIRGEDRERVVLDGELRLSNGIVATGARVTVENLTVRNFLQNGVLVTGVTDDDGAGVARGPDGYLPEEAPPPVPGYLVQYVTAANNGLYGIYAFNRTGGIIRENQSSGGSDSGIYVGQCEHCNAWVTDNVVLFNAVGIELANASGVTISSNRIVDNRVGITVLSNYLEAHGPSESVTIVGNVIANNDQAATPVQANGAFGVGIGLAGTVDGVVRANLVTGNENVGIWLTSSEDFAPVGNRVEENVTSGNGVDVVYAPAALASGQGNCLVVAADVVTEPVTLAATGCTADLVPGSYVQPLHPPGISFGQVSIPDPRRGLGAVDDEPRTIGDVVDIPDLRDLPVPSPDLHEKDAASVAG